MPKKADHRQEMLYRMRVEVDFSCWVCGVTCAVAPDYPDRAVCPDHCEDHDYVYEKGEQGHFCKHCGQQRAWEFEDGIDYDWRGSD